MKDWNNADTLLVLSLLLLVAVCSVDFDVIQLNAPAFIVDNDLSAVSLEDAAR
jgi:hypothetical protein